MTSTCQICHVKRPESKRVYTGTDGSYVCDQCLDEAGWIVSTSECDDCGKTWDDAYITSALVLVDDSNILFAVCPNCLAEKYVTCSGCYEYVRARQATICFDGNVYCFDCARQFDGDADDDQEKDITFKKNGENDAIINDPRSEA